MVNYTLLAGGYGTVISLFTFQAGPFNPDPSSYHPGNLMWIKDFPGGSSPSWIGLNRHNASVMCATQEVEAGSAVTYVIDRSRGDMDISLTLVSNLTVQGNGPPFCDFTDDNELALFPVYGGQQLAAFKAHDGGAKLSDIQKVSFGNDSKPHQAVEVKDEIFVPDLGLDKIWRLERSKHDLKQTGWIEHPPKSGPRHIVVKDNCLVTLHETASTITTQRIPSKDAHRSDFISTFTTPPAGSKLENFAAAEVKLIPGNKNFKGDIIFASNRQIKGEPSEHGDTIASFHFSAKKCSLKPLEQNPTGLVNLRGMEPDPTGRFIVTASSVKGGVKVFERIGKDGASLKEVSSDTRLANATTFIWLKQSDYHTW